VHLWFDSPQIKVIKTRPDRPVQPVRPWTGPISGPISPKNHLVLEPRIKPENQSEIGKTGGFVGPIGWTVFRNFIRWKKKKWFVSQTWRKIH